MTDEGTHGISRYVLVPEGVLATAKTFEAGPAPRSCGAEAGWVLVEFGLDDGTVRCT